MLQLFLLGLFGTLITTLALAFFLFWLKNKNSKRKFLNFLILPKFQLRYCCLFFIITLFTTFAISYAILYYAEQRNSGFINKLIHTVNNAENTKGVSRIIRSIKTSMHGQIKYVHFILISLSVLSSVIVFIGGLFITHRIAGPLFRITEYFDQNKWLKEPLAVRKEDEFEFLTNDINTLRNNRLYRIEQVQQQLEDLLKVNSDPELMEIIQNIKRINQC